jgi:hypothetical protein
LTSGGKKIIFNNMNDLRYANTDGRRNEKPLTEEQKEQAIGYAVCLGISEDRVYIVNHALTAYGVVEDVLLIGTDVLPLDKRVKAPNSNISLKGTIAHELIGHREAALGGFAQPVEVLEEAQASIRAARFAPDLSRQERLDLLKDAICRLLNEGIKLRDVKNKLHINER